MIWFDAKNCVPDKLGQDGFVEVLCKVKTKKNSANTLSFVSMNTAGGGCAFPNSAPRFAVDGLGLEIWKY